MIDYIDKIITVEKRVSSEFGKFKLFGLFEREDVKDKWDILISLMIPANKRKAIITKIHKDLLKVLPKEAIISISRIVFLEPSNPIVQNLNMTISLEHGSVSIKDTMINNLKVGNAILISSQT